MLVRYTQTSKGPVTTVKGIQPDTVKLLHHQCHQTPPKYQLSNVMKSVQYMRECPCTANIRTYSIANIATYSTDIETPALAPNTPEPSGKR